MSPSAIVVRQGEGARVGNVEFLTYILEGELTFMLGGEDVTAPAGTFVLVPPGVEHGFRNDTAEPVRILNIHAPAGFDRRIGLQD